MKRPSLVWRFFDRVLQNGMCIKVVCKLCEKQYKFFGNTTNLRVHLTNIHPMQWELLNGGETSFHESEDENEKPTTSSRKQKRSLSTRSVDVSDTDIAEVIEENEDGQDVINLKLLQNSHAKIEWLDEEEISHFEVYEPSSKTPKRMNIKREAISPPTQRCAKSTENDVQTQSRDEFAVFGEYIGNKIRNFTNPRTRGNIQQLITTILWQAEYGLYDHADSVKKLLKYAAQPTSVAESVQVEVDHMDENGVEHEERNASLGLII